jgi:3-carboxy-cis,cis-muconate cycloisomerase
MGENLEATRGLIYAEGVTVRLAARLGKQEARRAVEAACQQAIENREHLRDVLLATPAILQHLPEQTLRQLFNANNYLGSSSSMINKVLETARAHDDKPSRKGE